MNEQLRLAVHYIEYSGSLSPQEFHVVYGFTFHKYPQYFQCNAFGKVVILEAFTQLYIQTKQAA